MQTRDAVLISIFIVVAVAAAWYFGATLSSKENNPPNPSTDHMMQNTEQDQTSAPSRAVLHTNKGAITIEFFENVPVAVGNFITLSENDFYDGTKFHRVIKDFMIQGGDPLSKDDSQKATWGQGGPGYTFPDEPSDNPLIRGVVAMANAGPDTNGSQFFIITAEATPWLDGKHTPFARVVSGMDIVQAISEVETEGADVPVVPIVVEDVELQ